MSQRHPISFIFILGGEAEICPKRIRREDAGFTVRSGHTGFFELRKDSYLHGRFNDDFCKMSAM